MESLVVVLFLILCLYCMVVPATSKLPTSTIVNILNGGMNVDIFQYANVQMSAGKLYSSFSSCESHCKSPDTPCAKIGQNSWLAGMVKNGCVAPEKVIIGKDKGQSVLRCPNGYVCCGGAICQPPVVYDCRYDMEQLTKQISVLHADNEKIDFASILQEIETQGEAVQAAAASILATLLSSSDMNSHCANGCNNWNSSKAIDESKEKRFCPDACKCTGKKQAQIIPGDDYWCTNKVKDGVFYSSGKANENADVKKPMCPKGYDCANEAKCQQFQASSAGSKKTGSGENAQTTKQGPTGKKEEAGNNTIWFIVGGCVLAAVAILIGFVIYKKKKTKKEPYEPTATREDGASYVVML